MIRRLFLPAALLAALLIPTVASAKSWRTFTYRPLHFSVQYPSGWHVKPTNRPPVRQAAISNPKAIGESIGIFLLRMSTSGSIRDVARRWVAYEKKITKSSIYQKIKWSSTSMAGRPAVVGVVAPPKKSKLNFSDAIYLSTWRGSVYDMRLFVAHKPPFTKLTQFPTTLRRIAKTLRFI